MSDMPERIIAFKRDIGGGSVHPFWTDAKNSVSSDGDSSRTKYIRAERERELVELLMDANCPTCDGSGAIVHGDPYREEFELEQCEWCARRDEALANKEQVDE